MEEIMYSGIDSLDNQPSLIWVRGEKMGVSTDFGPDDSWRDPNIPAGAMLFKLELDLTRFTDLTVVWERNS